MLSPKLTPKPKQDDFVIAKAATAVTNMERTVGIVWDECWTNSSRAKNK